MMVALRSDHDVHGRRAADDLRALGLRDAARNRDAHLAAITRRLILGDPQPPEFGVDLFGGLLADMAGVGGHQIRIPGAVSLDKTLARPRVPPSLRLVDV